MCAPVAACHWLISTEDQESAVKTIAAALCDEEITVSNSIATLMTDCMAIRNRDRQSHTVISLTRISNIKVVKSSRVALLAISGGLFIVAAAALCSKDGGGAEIPAVLLGALFLFGYWGSRSASILLSVDSEAIQSIDGKRPEAAAIVDAVLRWGTALESAATPVRSASAINPSTFA